MNKWTRRFEWKTIPGSAARRPAPDAHHYFAFLSYSHQDRAEADWLHEQLEGFRVPSSLAGRLTANGVIPKRLAPIFRDQHDLAASHDLTDEIRLALAASRCLIVLCSPAAANSEWTNAEIDCFRRLHPEACIIAAVLSGEPLASEMAGREKEECFPPALLTKYDRRGRPTGKKVEPLAADLRGAQAERRTGFLKIVAGILGVGLDDLVQRDSLRRQRRLALVTAGSLSGMVIASVLAVTAIEARDEARDQRKQAENLIGFMLGDLKDKLEPIGRLDVLDSVGSHALAYYQKQDTSELTDDALAQRSKALTLMGQVASVRGDQAAALGFYKAAFQGTAEALRRSPGDPQRIYDHAQNVFYLGDVARSRGDLKAAEAGAREYKRLAEQLIATDPANPKWQMEGVYADTDLGVLLSDEGRYSDAAAVFANALADRERLVSAYPANEQYRKAVSEVLAWLSDARENEGRLDDALSQRERQLALLGPIIARPDADVDYVRQAMVAYRAAGRLHILRGDTATGAKLLQTAIDMGDRLLQAEPSNTEWMWNSTRAKFDLARVNLARNDVDAASALVRSACDSTDRLIAKDSSIVDWRVRGRGDCFELTARTALARGIPDEAQNQAAKMVGNAKAELTQNGSADAQLGLVTAWMMSALAARAEGRISDSGKSFRAAASAWPKSAPDKPANIARKVVILQGVGRSADAERLAERLAAMGYREPIYLRDARAVGVK